MAEVLFMKKTFLYFLLTFTALSFFTWNCTKSYNVAPLGPVAPTATPTAYPCGYPGNTCTFTSTPTATGTPTFTGTPTVTSSPTQTYTPTQTSTPTPLPSPSGIFGLQDTSNYPSIIWVKDSNPNITSYKIYVSTDDATWTLLANPLKTAFTAAYCQVNDTTQTAPFTRYYYVVSSNGGTPPDSLPSPQVWAISGTTTQNTLTFNVTGPTPLNCAITSGSVPEGVNQIWVVEDTSQNPYWTWGEEGTGLTNVNYGYSATGLTYLPAQTLTPGTIYAFGIFTVNSNNWVIDESAQGFTDP